MVVRRHPLSQQRFAAVARQMCDDPDLTHHVLQLGLVLAEHLTRTDTAGTAWMQVLSERVAGYGGTGEWVRSAIRADLPRHVADEQGHRCAGTMIRRDTPCGRSAGRRHHVYDAMTGARTVLGSCPRHRDELCDLERSSREAWIAAGSRPGPQNAGGVLERYFTADWDTIYASVMPSWKRPGDPAEPRRRPQLRLILGGLEG